MQIDWSPLRRTLAALRRDVVPLPLWWRDDDAVAPTKALDRLQEMSLRLSLPVHLAVVPKHASRDLAAYLTNSDALIPVTHGWAHKNNAGPDQKKSEYGTARAGAVDEITAAYSRMNRLFSARHLSVFVPPWNRLHDGHCATLVDVGYKAVSTFAPRENRYATKGLLQINTHIDPIEWRGSRDLVAPETLISQVAHVLEARRRGDADASEPLGYLTHHLVHTEKVWEVSEQMLTELLEGGAYAQPLRPLWETTE